MSSPTPEGPAHLAPRGRAGRRTHALAWTVLLATCGVLFAVSFERWGDPVIDLGRELWIAGELASGRVLYRDVVYNYGPVAPYLLAAVVFVAGDSLAVFEAVGVLIGVATMAGLYATGFLLGGVIPAFATAWAFVLLCFFANTTWGANFVLPHAYAATLAIATAVGAFALLLRHLAARRRRDLILGALLACITLATKLEVGAAILGVYAVAGWAHRLPLRPLAAVAGGAFLAGVVLALLFRAQEPGDHALVAESLGKLLSGSALRDPFFLRVAGLERPGRSLASLAAGAAGLALLGAATAAAASLPGAWRSRRVGALALGVAGALGVAVLLPVLADVRMLGVAVLAAPVVAIACVASDRRDPLLLLAVFVVLSAPRILLQYHPYWYGYTLSVPALPFVVHGLGVRLPRRTAFPLFARGVLVALALLAVHRFESDTIARYQAMTASLDTPKGRMRDLPVGRAAAIEGLLAHFEAMPKDRERTLVVFPEGISLNYFSGLRNPTGYYLFTPPEVPDAAAEARVLAALRDEPPDFVVLVPRDLAEYGSAGFGRDYVPGIRRWIEQGYRRVRVFRDPEARWPLQLWERRDRRG